MITKEHASEIWSLIDYLDGSGLVIDDPALLAREMASYLGCEPTDCDPEYNDDDVSGSSDDGGTDDDGEGDCDSETDE